MPSTGIIYFAGVLTPVAMVLVGYFLVWFFLMFKRSGITQGKCDICVDAGYTFWAYKSYSGEQNSWVYYFTRFKHRIAARLPKHRDSWEKYFSSRPVYRTRYEENRKKYGRPNMKMESISHEE